MLVEKDIDDPELGQVTVRREYDIQKLPPNLFGGFNLVAATRGKEGEAVLTLQKNRTKQETKNIVSAMVLGWKESHLEGIEKPGYLGYEIRTTIKKAGKFSHRELCMELEAKGFKNPKMSGSVKEAIVILRDDRREIELIGRGDRKSYTWIGSK